MVDLATLKSLQIFVDEPHPSNMGIGKAKEGFSVFGLFHSQCSTNMASQLNSYSLTSQPKPWMGIFIISLQGKRLLRLWMLRPVVNLSVVSDRQDTVELLINAPDVMGVFKDVLKKVCRYWRKHNESLISQQSYTGSGHSPVVTKDDGFSGLWLGL